MLLVHAKIRHIKANKMFLTASFNKKRLQMREKVCKPQRSGRWNLWTEHFHWDLVANEFGWEN